MSSTTRIELLGPVRVVGAHGPIELRGVTGRTVAACLALAEGRVVPVGHLVAALWDGEPPHSAGNVVQSAVSRLRAGIGREAVRRESDGYRLDLSLVTTDLSDLAHLGAAASSALDPATAAGLLEDALALWRGEALADVAATTVWLPERARLDEVRATLRDRRHLARLDAGIGSDTIADLQADARRAPLRESTQVLLMRALGESGRAAEALRVGAAYRRRLADDTGLLPSPAFSAVEQDLLALPDPLRLESSTRPEPGGPARPAMPRPRWAPPDNEFVGRAELVASVPELLHHRRLVTVLGPGGVGKTRLVMELLAQARRVGPEIVVVELASVAHGSDIVPTLAGRLGLLTSGTDLTDAVAERLDLLAGLLVLDNCEHVRHQTRDLVDLLLRRAPRLRILTTSRRRLGLAEEHVVRLDPLPPPTGCADDPTVRLFLDRMERIRHGSRSQSEAGTPAPANTPDPVTLRAAVDICRATEGMPLAIELAASRVALLGLEGLRSRLEASLEVLSLPGTDRRRQATLDTTIDWSIDLLDPHSIAVLEELSVFPDNFSFDDADAVVVGDLLPALAELVDSSLVDVDDSEPVTRYRLLASIREHARRRLDATGRTRDVLDAHAAWAMSLGEAIESDWMSTDPRCPERTLAGRRIDLVQALRHLGDTGRIEDADRLARHISMELLAHPIVGFTSLLPTIRGHSLDAVVARAVVAIAMGRPSPDELAELERLAAAVDTDDRRRHLLQVAVVSAHLYRGDIDGAEAVCTAMVVDPDTPPRIRAVVVSMWALARVLCGDVPRAEAIIAAHQEVLGVVELGGFVAYVRAEVAAPSDPERALRFLELAREQSQDPNPGLVTRSADVLSLSLLVRSGDHDGAGALARTLVPELMAAGMYSHVWIALRALAHVLVPMGRVDEAAMALSCADLDARAQTWLGPWAATIDGLWTQITGILGTERVAAIRAQAHITSLVEVWARTDRALRTLAAA